MQTSTSAPTLRHRGTTPASSSETPRVVATAASTAPPAAAGWFRSWRVQVPAQAQPVSGYVRIRDREGHWLHSDLVATGTSVVMAGARAAWDVWNLYQHTGTRYLDRNYFAGASVRGGFDLFYLQKMGIPMAQWATGLAIDHVQDRKERQAIGRFTPKEQLARIVQLGNAQLTSSAGLARSIAALQQVQAAYPEAISGQDLGQAIVQLAARQLRVWTDKLNVWGLATFTTDKRINKEDIERLWTAVCATQTGEHLAPDQATQARQLLCTLAQECAHNLRRTTSAGSHPELLESLGNVLIDLFSRMPSDVPGATEDDVRAGLQQLLRLQDFVTEPTFQRIFALTCQGGWNSTERLDHVAHCLTLAPNNTPAPTRAALLLATELLNQDPGAWSERSEHTPARRAAEFVRSRLGTALTAGHTYPVVEHLELAGADRDEWVKG